MIDFDMMLVSILPHKYFILYLQEERKDKVPFLNMIHLVKLYSDEGQKIEELKKQISLAERRESNSSGGSNRVAKDMNQMKRKMNSLIQKMKKREESAYKIAKANKNLFIDNKSVLI